MHWKQPTTTEIICDELNALDQAIFRHIIAHAQNGPYSKVFFHGNKRIDLRLERGQTLFNVSEYARSIGINRKSIQKSLKKCKKWANERASEIKITKKSYGLIIAFVRYDELIEMPKVGQRKGQRTGQRRDNEGTSNNKSDKSDYNKEDNTYTFGMVSLPLTEWNELTDTYGLELMEEMVEELDGYCRSKKAKYQDYKATLENWIRRNYGLPSAKRHKLEKLSNSKWGEIVRKNPKALRVLKNINYELWLEVGVLTGLINN